MADLYLGYIRTVYEGIGQLIEELRTSRGDRTDVEVKAAKGGLPRSLESSLSALANLPGGGLIVLGLDESAGFVPVGLNKVQQLKQALGNRARNYLPPVQLTIDDAKVDGVPVVVATVHECDPSAKPCRVRSTGRAYLRSYDGDYELSDIEEQAFLAARKAPHLDRQAVSGTNKDDLDRESVAAWMDAIRSDSAAALGRFRDDDELLRRAGIVSASGELSVAGLLVFGAYPQLHRPRYVVQAAAAPLPGDPPGTRARNVATFDGPIPVILAGVQRWVAQNMSSVVAGDPSGDVRTVYDYPLEAVRELVTNALVHRDLDAWSEGLAVEVRLRGDRFVVTNPGGLYGITVDRLGKEHVTSARNQRLVSLCQHARLPGRDARVIEGLATGLPKVAAELASAGLPPAQFIDEGIRFTVVLRSVARDATVRPASLSLQAAVPAVQPTTVAVELPEGSHLATVYTALTKPATAQDLATATGLKPTSVRTALHALRTRYGVVEQIGGRGRRTVYRRVR